MKHIERPTELDASRYYGIYVLYIRMKEIVGFFFTWSIIIIILTGGKITVHFDILEKILSGLNQ